jgi:putative FmdB family regulatory protein
MPTYVYRGETTGVEFEVEQRITEAPLSHHPQTGEPVRRVIQAAGIVFKGSGFYKTDSRSGTGGGASGGSKSEGSSAASSTSDSKGDTSSKSGDSTSGDSTPAPAAAAKAD